MSRELADPAADIEIDREEDLEDLALGEDYAQPAIRLHGGGRR